VGWQPTTRRDRSRPSHPGGGRPGCRIRPLFHSRGQSPFTTTSLAGHRSAAQGSLVAARRCSHSMERTRPSCAVPPWGELVHPSGASVAHARARQMLDNRGVGPSQRPHPRFQGIRYVPSWEATTGHRLAFHQPSYPQMCVRLLRTPLVPAAHVPQGRLDVLARPCGRLPPCAVPCERTALFHLRDRDAEQRRHASSGVLQHTSAELRVDELSILLHRSHESGCPLLPTLEETQLAQ